MSFGNYARKVRDQSLPYGRRVTALACGVQMYRPLGFRATFAFVTDRNGRFRYDGNVLVQAMDRLEASRALWVAEVAAYAELRVAAKQDGNRRPGKAEGNPVPPSHWYGDRRQGALFAIQYMLTSNDDSEARSQVDAGVKRLATLCLENSGVFDGAHQRRYRELRHETEHRRDATGQPDASREEWARATVSLRLLDHIGNAIA
jgi:hypothetical protein